MTGCSVSKNMPKESNAIVTLDSELILGDIGEDGVAELVLPEMLAYADMKKQIDARDNIEKMEFGSELKVDDESEISIIVNEEINKEFTPVSKTDKRVELPMNTSTEESSEKEFQEYIVQKNDSLMLISYKFFRDFSRWRDIRKWNMAVLGRENKLLPGQKLNVLVTDYEGNVWRGNGNSYLIKRGDFLSGISKKVYNGVAKYWTNIWKNNNTLIKDPDKIYAGFTIYTPTIESINNQNSTDKKGLQREVSSG